MNYIDLFSGIGGFALGAYWVGVRFDEHYFSEVDSYCCELYKMRFPSAIQLGDICKIDFENLPKTEWIISGGFPCQDISIAGKGEGISGKRSSLWFAMFKSIRILRPRFAIIENVGAITHRGLDTVLGCLAEIGYDAEWQDISANKLDAWHKRSRIWIVAYPRGERRPRTICSDFKRLKEKIKKTNALDTQCNPFLQFEERVGEPAVFGVDDGLSHRVDRLKALGNSIVPQIAELLFRQIKDMVYETSTSL